MLIKIRYPKHRHGYDYLCFKYAAVILTSRLAKNNAYKTYFRESLETVIQQEWQEIAKISVFLKSHKHNHENLAELGEGYRDTRLLQLVCPFHSLFSQTSCISFFCF